MKQIFAFCCGALLLANTSLAANAPQAESDDFIPAEILLQRAPDATECATAVFANALKQNAGAVSDASSETDVQSWIYQTFALPDVLQSVMSCPEVANAAPDDTIKFLPIEYTFPQGRKIVINYETQPKILSQRILIGDKRNLPTDTDPSPRIGGANDTSIWTNTDPAWYGILVVQSGSLDEFIGDGKNNTISLKYIEDNIDRIYPQGANCTSKTALAGDNKIINVATRNAIGVPGDTNDYYIAGDKDLRWISYAEIGLDVVLSVATFGGWTALSGTTKAARASKTLKNLGGTVRDLSKMDSVRNYMRLTAQQGKLTQQLKTLDKATNAAEYTKISDNLKDINKTIKQMEKADDNVKKYRDASKTFSDLNAYRHTLQGTKRTPKTGNVATRAWHGLRATLKGAKAARSGNKLINKGAKLARASTMSGRIRDWLFSSTLRNAGALSRVAADTGLIYGIVKFAGDMYDHTEVSTGEFTNNIEFRPLGLLSADDLDGQENIVNYGMWLMWMGDATSAADDDAAYLQAMDFAAKFHQDLELVIEERGAETCDVDIFVVRPVIRNPGDANAALYYMIMNDAPWTTSEVE